MIDFNYWRSEEGKTKMRLIKDKELKEAKELEELRLKTCAFTGHRPQKLEGGYDWKHPKNIELAKAIRNQVLKLIEEENVNRFIFGGALGIDQMSFAICNRIKETKYPDLYLILAMPFENQANKWFKQEDRDRLIKQKELANEVILVDELKDFRYSVNNIPDKIYHPAKMQKRNEYMFDNCNYLIAIWDGTNSGTGNCVKYARKSIGSGVAIIKIHPKTLNVEISYC